MPARNSGVKNGLFRSLAWTAALVALLSSAGTVSAAIHGTMTLPCHRCHTLDLQNVDPTTGSLLRAAPNLDIMKGMTAPLDVNLDGIQDAPNVLGCYLCHTQADRVLPTDKMKYVSGDFGTQSSVHPVGRLLKPAGGTDTQNEFQSNWSGNALDRKSVV